MTERSADIAIVGAGIVGLAHAYMALRKGYKVILFEREQFAIGASVRNFGLVWPIGQVPGPDLDRALRGREHWQEVAANAKCWINMNGSLHLAYNEDEWQVLNEFMALYKEAPYRTTLLSPGQTAERSGVVKRDGLYGALWSETEGTVYAREAVRRIAGWLTAQYGLTILYGHVVTGIDMPVVSTARGAWKVDKVFVCSGADFETLYPTLYEQHGATKCKLQMMKAVTSTPVALGPTLCAGLTLRHYAAFGACPSLPKLDTRYDAASEAFKANGVHVLLAQNGQGELIIGDSHHYGATLEPFDAEHINTIILDYLSTFTSLPALTITERWHGIYPKVAGQTHLLLDVAPGVTVVNGLGGAGMTLSFGLAEEVIARL